MPDDIVWLTDQFLFGKAGCLNELVVKIGQLSLEVRLGDDERFVCDRILDI